MQREFEAANRVIERALAINPKSVSLWGLKAKLAIYARGDLTVAEKGLAEYEQAKARGELPKNQDPERVCGMGLGKAGILSIRRRYPEALEALRQLPQDALNSLPEAFFEVRLSEGILHERLGQAAEARAAFLQAKELAEAAVREAPNDAPRHAKLGRTLAYLGEKEAAIAEAKRASELLPESSDAFSGPGMTQALAEVYMVTGENAKAIELLDGLLSRPSELTVAFLKLDPTVDRLRDDPDFQKVLAKHERGT
jgi:tetratricopeptide (TPR) repeat protein